MFIRLPRSDKVISLVGKGLDIIRLPDKDDTELTMQFALVLIHNTADPPPPAALDEHRSDDAYWNKFEIIAECETHEAGEIRLGQPLEPLLDEICQAIEAGVRVLDWRSKTKYITFAEVQEMDRKAERKREEEEAKKKDAEQRRRNERLDT